MQSQYDIVRLVVDNLNSFSLKQSLLIALNFSEALNIYCRDNGLFEVNQKLCDLEGTIIGIMVSRSYVPAVVAIAAPYMRIPGQVEAFSSYGISFEGLVEDYESVYCSAKNIHPDILFAPAALLIKTMCYFIDEHHQEHCLRCSFALASYCSALEKLKIIEPDLLEKLPDSVSAYKFEFAFFSITEQIYPEIKDCLSKVIAYGAKNLSLLKR